MEKNEKDSGAGLIHQVASPLAEIEPRPILEKLVRLTREDDYEKRWIVVGKHGAIDFHCAHANSDSSRRYGRMGGVEYHHRRPASYMRADYGCVDDHCWVLSGKCYYDGTSLWASEHWIPLLESCGEAAIWRELEITYRKHEWAEIETASKTADTKAEGR